jgi:hypothetical protein
MADDLDAIDVGELYPDTGAQKRRKALEGRLDRAQNPTQTRKVLSKYIQKAKSNTGFALTVADGDEEDEIYAFEETVRWVQKNQKENSYARIEAVDLRGQVRAMVLNKNRLDIDGMMRYLRGRVFDEDSNASDSRYNITDVFDPVEMRLVIPTTEKTGNRRQTITTNQESHKGVHTTVEDVPLYSRHNGEFWPFINKSGVDLTDLQIFPSINASNYTDNCFIYSCIQSWKFHSYEIEDLRLHIHQSKVPTNVLCQIEKHMNCFFQVSRINESYPKKSRIRTRPMPASMKKKKDLKVIPLLLYKDHWMFYGKDLPVTPFYIQWKSFIDEGYPDLELEERQLINGFDKDRKPIFYEMNKTNRRNIMPVLDAVFETKGFEPMSQEDEAEMRMAESQNSYRSIELYHSGVSIE